MDFGCVSIQSNDVLTYVKSLFIFVELSIATSTLLY